MHLQSLHLLKYGIFADRQIEFGPGCTVVFGANEAGKSTLHHALGDFLWGIPGRRHPYAHTTARRPSDMRLTGTIEVESRTRELARRLAVLTDSDGSEVEPPWATRDIASREVWSTWLGMDLDGLQQGGRDVLAGRGDLADVIFLAETGHRLDDARKSIQAKADDLYRRSKGAKKVTVRELLADLESRAETIRATEVKAQDVVQERSGIEALSREIERLRADEAAAAQLLSRAEELARCWTPATTLEGAEQRLQDAGEAGEVLDRTALQTLESATRASDAASGEIDVISADQRDLERQLAALELQPRLTAHEESITQLSTRIAMVTQASAAIADDSALRAARRGVVEALERLGCRDTSDLEAAAASVRLSVDQRAQLTDSSKKARETSDELQSLQQRLADEDRRVRDLDSVKSGEDTSELRAARSQRDASWLAVREPWLSADLPDDEARREAATRLDSDIQFSDAVAERHGKDLAAQGAHRARLAEARKAVDELSKALASAEAEADRSRAAWDGFAAACGLTEGMQPEHWETRATALDDLGNAWDDWQAAESTREQNEQLVASFATDLEPMRGLLTDPPKDPVACARALQGALEGARSAADRALVLQEQADRLAPRLEKLQRKLARATADIDRIMAGRSTDLVTLRDRSTAVHNLQDEAANQRDLLRAAMNPDSDIEQVRGALRGTTQESLAASQNTAQEDLAAVRTTLEGKIEERRSSADRLRKLEAGQSTAELGAEQQNTAADLDNAVQEYLSLRIQLALLDAYRADVSGRGGQGLLDTAGGNVAALTDGRYTGFSPLIESDGSRAIRILRAEPDGGEESEMELHELSEGSADQAFLALRLAGMQQRLSSADGRVPPVVLDDVLMAFDDERSLAALRLLAELGESYQILLMTHHRRILEQAAMVAGIATVELH
jgi:uncharacterized protein YhaN